MDGGWVRGQEEECLVGAVGVVDGGAVEVRGCLGGEQPEEERVGHVLFLGFLPGFRRCGRGTARDRCHTAGGAV